MKKKREEKKKRQEKLRRQAGARLEARLPILEDSFPL